MIELKTLDDDAYSWLEGKDLAQWSKSHFSTDAKCNMLLNNLCEYFNKYILDAMDKPILTMMETIRINMMQRIAKKHAATEMYPGPLCPKIRKKLEDIVIESTRCWPKHAGGLIYEVVCGLAN
ncbi:hypothetical protein CRYUN_Cryun33cG0021800 [Craigia yunnanensis]